MKTLEKISKIDQLQMGYWGSLLRQHDQVIIFDFTPRTLKLVSLRKEVHGKYATSEDGVYRYNFAIGLLEDLRKRAACMEDQNDLCIALFCSDSEQPCIFTYPELSELVGQFGKPNYFDLCIKLDRRSFKVDIVTDGGIVRHQIVVSKKASQAKVFH